MPPPAPSSAFRAPAAQGPAAARPASSVLSAARAAAGAELRRRPARVRTWPWRAGEEAGLLQIVRSGTLSAAARESPSRTRASLTFWGRTAATLGTQHPPVRETAVVWARWAELDPGAAAAESEEEEDEVPEAPESAAAASSGVPAASSTLPPAAVAQLVRAASLTEEQFGSLADADRRCCLCQTPFKLPLGLVSHLGRSVCRMPDREAGNDGGRRARRTPPAGSPRPRRPRLPRARAQSAAWRAPAAAWGVAPQRWRAPRGLESN